MHTLSTFRRRIPAQSDLPTVVELPSGSLRLHRLLGRGKSGYSYHAVRDRREVVFKYMHDEECGYYHFAEAKTTLEERDYHRLREIGLRVPDLLAADHERGFLIKEYIPGMTAAEVIAEGLPSPALLGQLFDFASASRAAGVNIDYFPTNFVIRDGQLYYIDYETNPYDAAWSLEYWGLYYWANPAGMRAFLRDGSTVLLRDPGDASMPLRAPFEPVVRSWIQEFGAAEAKTTLQQHRSMP